MFGRKKSLVPPEELSISLDYWNKRWEENKTGWHVNSVNGNLVLYMEMLTGYKCSVRNEESFIRNGEKKFFVPLCGKTRDIAYLLSLGFQVFAVECSQLAIEKLQEENQFQLEFHKEESVYRSGDGKLVIYFGDFFTCPIEKWAPFDFLWDRGSLIAVEYTHRLPYIQVIQRSLKNRSNQYHCFRYLLETVEYDRTKYAGPPRVVDENDVKELYSSWTDYKLLERYPLPEEHNLRKIKDMGPNCNQSLYIITPKKLN